MHQGRGAQTSPAAAAARRYAKFLDVHMFRDRAAVMGGVAAALGNAHQIPAESAAHLPNGSVLFWSLMLVDSMTDKHFDGSSR